MTGSVVILTGHHVCHNPRAFKEAEALAGAGFDVLWLGGWFSLELAERDRDLIANKRWKFIPVVDWTRTTRVAKIRKQRQRIRRWFGTKRFGLIGSENVEQLGYSGRELLKAARQRGADLYIAHSETALWAAERLGRLGCRFGVDMEDWFSENLLPEVRRLRPVKLLRTLERKLLHDAAYASCTSHAMSEALTSEYECDPPAVIYNAFSWAERNTIDGQYKDRKDRRVPSIHWYSQTLGHGRGLEELLAALPHVKHEVDIHLRGNPVSGFENWLASLVPEGFRKRIFIHNLVPNAELLSRISEHDVGFAGEMKYCRNRDLTVTNKILHYLLGGLAVVASDTAGQKEIAQQASSAVFLYPSGEPQRLAQQLNLLFAVPDLLRAAKAAALRAAEEKFCWEKIAPLLIRNVEDALHD